VKVLVAHGAPEVSELVRAALAPLSADVVDATTCPAALATVRTWLPDVVLLSGALCAEQNMDLLARIKGDRAAYAASVVLVTGALDVKAMRRESERGIHDVLVEPLREFEILARVMSAFRAKHLAEALLEEGRRRETALYEDVLTGIYNRRFMMAQLEASRSGARRHGRPLSVVALDIDNFKRLNDSYGHAVGDRALVAVARALRARLRREDSVARMGGEEFLALLPDIGPEGAARVAESLRVCASEVAVHAQGQRLPITVSAGWATLQEEETVDGLLRRADRGLYAAKEAGRDLVRPG
jgi:diguanylate cyclase (GGDEF)-like protein